MEPTTPPQHVRVLLERIARDHGIQSPRIEVESGSDQGDNFVAVIVRAKVLETVNNEGKTLNLIVKHAPENAKRRELYYTHGLFKHEIFMYDVVLPTLTRLLQSKGAVTQDQLAFPGTARVYATHLSEDGAEDTIIMEDMKALGYVMGDRIAGADAEQCRIVIRQLARLHAASLVLKEEDPEKHSEIAKILQQHEVLNNPSFLESMQALSEKSIPMIADRFPEGTEEHTKFEGFIRHASKIISEIGGGDYSLKVISHGDIWINNVLLKYEPGNTVPTDACLIDLQCSEYTSPVCDLSYLLFCSTTKSMRDQHLKQLLRDYHQFLCGFLQTFGYPSDKIVTWNVMEDNYCKCMKYGLAAAAMTVPVIMSEKGDLQGVGDQIDESTTLEDTLTVTVKNQAGNERMSDVLQDMLDMGYL